MTASETDALAARWRRLEHGLDEVRAAVRSADRHQCPDAVARTLGALYDLWEFWSSHVSRPPGRKKGQAEDDAVSGDVEGETAAALVHARGMVTHAAVEFGDFTDTIADEMYDHWGCWRFQDHSDPACRFRQRDSWYAVHVRRREVLPPLESAARWLRAQPELSAPAAP